DALANNSTAQAIELGGGDTTYSVWFKPFANDLLTLRAGYKPGDDYLRYGNMSAGDTIEGTGKFEVSDFINAFGGNNYGFIITSQPIEPLFIGLAYQNNERGKVGEYYPGIQFGAGYTIGGIGAARVQFFGPYAFDYKNETLPLGFTLPDLAGLNATYVGTLVDQYTDGSLGLNLNSIQVGFKVLALENMGLLLDVVGKVPLAYKAYDEDNVRIILNDAIKVGVLASFNAGAFGVTGGIGVKLPYTLADVKWGTIEAKVEGGLELDIHVEPTYAVTDQLTVGADLGFIFDKYGRSGMKVDGESLEMSAWNVLGLGAFAKYTVGKGTFKAGITVTMDDLSGKKDDGEYTTTTIKVPLSVNVAF
ncbi:MAG: hypothetical protein LBH58_01695, partial [Tannerellaceae bacterium]|nr:hypothetical protein [Tannerellaceae bacterium]